MSDMPPTGATPPSMPPSGPRPEQRSGCLTAILLIVGIIMLLPGLCALFFGGLALTERHDEIGVLPFVLVGLAIGFAGVMLIWNVIRGFRS
ncbi:MAG: hypothetical protein JOY90_05635 [Bradyrhizobium sp.]|uniref:hypothetical protein n=1 Tax=Bradyrhizobium sp. TaxID=376 RepID=UPI001D84B89D|nr:hypothetical protein [Bradyrhizobium sp.]MBV9559931.1 hypothetical protein [Bradyrhizobium sp.]